MKLLAVFVTILLENVAFSSATEGETQSKPRNGTTLCGEFCYGRGYRSYACVNENCDCSQPGMQEE